MLWLLLLVGFVPLLLRWNSDGHILMTRDGMKGGLDRLSDQQLLGMGVSRASLTRMLAWLGLYNTAEDVEWCNFGDVIFGKGPEKAANLIERIGQNNPFMDSCAVTVGGDQVTHYMSSYGTPALPSYYRSNKQIREYSWLAWELLNESFHHMRGFLGTLQGIALEAQNTSVFDMVFGGAVQDVISQDHEGTWISKLGVPYAWVERHGADAMSMLPNLFRDGQHNLGRALHTLQDSFSPAHTRRDRGSGYHQLVTLYTYDDHNKLEPNYCPMSKSDGSVPGDETWPGHHVYDRWLYDAYTQQLKGLAVEASADLIFAVFNSIGANSSAFGSALDGVFSKWLQGSIVDIELG
jgi:hypothetical protein